MLGLTIAALCLATGSRNKIYLATEPFQPILQVLADLERDDPKFAFPAARLVGLSRRLWESRVSKHITNEGCFVQELILQTRQMDNFEASDPLPGNWRYDRAIDLASLDDANIDKDLSNCGQPYEYRFENSFADSKDLSRDSSTATEWFTMLHAGNSFFSSVSELAAFGHLHFGGYDIVAMQSNNCCNTNETDCSCARGNKCVGYCASRALRGMYHVTLSIGQKSACFLSNPSMLLSQRAHIIPVTTYVRKP